MPNPYTWRGPLELKRGKATWDFQAEKVVVTFSYTGPFAKCLAERPAVGGTIQGFTDYGLRVTSARATEGDADTGELAVTLEAPIPADETVSFEGIGEPIYELEMGELLKPLETHPKCGTLKADRAAGTDGKKRTWEDWADLVVADYEVGDGGWTLEQYQSLKEKGIDSYPLAAPVIRRTLYYFRDPGGVGADLFSEQNPPGAAPAPDAPFGESWVYLLTADKLLKEGRLRTRVTEWTGALSLEPLIYD